MNAPRAQVATLLLSALFLGSLLFHRLYDTLLLVAYLSGLALALLAVFNETRLDKPSARRPPR